MPTGDTPEEQVGSCPHCGAPLYSDGSVSEDGTQEIRYTCNCRLQQGAWWSRPIPVAGESNCDHCYCQRDRDTTVSKPHVRCCKCGDRKLAPGTGWAHTRTETA